MNTDVTLVKHEDVTLDQINTLDEPKHDVAGIEKHGAKYIVFIPVTDHNNKTPHYKKYEEKNWRQAKRRAEREGFTDVLYRDDGYRCNWSDLEKDPESD